MTEMTRTAIHDKAGFTGRLPLGNQLGVLVVDFQVGFTDAERSPLAADCSAEVANTRQILDQARTLDIPICYSVIGYRNEKDAGLWAKKVPSLLGLMLGTDLVELDPRLNVQKEDTIIVKKYASAFAGTSLASLLTAQGVDTLIITGTTTSGCVRASAVDALQCGFAPYVVEDAVCDRSSEAHHSNLLDLKTKYAELITTAQLLSILRQL